MSDTAQANLEAVCKAIGATFVGQQAVVTLNGHEYAVGINYIHRDRICGTCFRHYVEMPWQEVIATALLWLYRDPTLFDKWRQYPGHQFCG